jgi:mannosyltransferase
MDRRATPLVATSTPAKWWLWALLSCTLLGGVLRFAALEAKTLWLDEAFSLWMAQHDLPSLLQWLVRIDHHPPLYYVLLHLWIALHTWIGGIGDSPSALRSLSALTSTLAIPLYALAARRLAGAQVGIVAALLLTLAPFHVRYGQETRMYGLLILAVALLFFALAHLLVTDETAEQRRRGRMWSLLAVAEAAAMLTHNTTTVLVPLALNLAIGGLWLAQRRGWLTVRLPGLEQPKFLPLWLLSQLGTLLLWLPWALPFVRQAQVVDSNFWIEPPNIGAVWTALSNLTFAHLPDWLPFPTSWTIVGVGLALWGIWRWGLRSALTWLLVVLWLMPPIVELLVSLRRPIFYDRTLIWTTLPYYLLIARGIVPSKPLRLDWRLGWLLLYLILCALGLWNYYTTFAKEDWDKVALHVATQAQPNDLILFHASWTELPFAYYYPENAPPLVHHGIPADLFDAGTLEAPMTEADIPHVRELISREADVWLVYSHWWYTDPEGLLLQVLGSELELVEQKEWPYIRLLHYVRP